MGATSKEAIERNRKRALAYYRANRDTINAHRRAERAADPEGYRLYGREYQRRPGVREKTRKKQREYYHRNKEKINAKRSERWRL